jgi:hypothetical protein
MIYKLGSQINWKRKLIAGLIISLFFSISIVSSANDINFKETVKGDPEIDNLNNCFVIIAYIQGSHQDSYKSGFVFNKPIEVYAYKHLWINGIKLPSSNLFDIHIDISVRYVKASHFFGIFLPPGSFPPRIMGFAIGNIEWE